MLQSAAHDELYPLVAPLVEKLGYAVVDLRSHYVRETLHVNLVIYRAEGVGIDDCSEVYRDLFARIQLTGEDREIHLEVSSPGLTRNLKSVDEFRVFRGRDVQVLAGHETEWTTGRISDVGEGFVLLENEGGTRRLGFAEIRKARLDFTQEVRK